MNEVLQEVDRISKIISEKFPRQIDGKEAVLWMKQFGINWKQMEWMGFYFEEFLFKVLKDNLGGEEGPLFGRTRIDYKNKFIWDFKSHSECNSNGQKVCWAIMNDKEAIEKCINNFGGIGFILGEFGVVFDSDQSFKKWHDDLKGEKSEYVLRREKEGASQRVRKKEVILKRVLFIYFKSVSDLKEGLKNGWLSGFQEGMRNSNNLLRRVKIQCNLSKIPPKYILKEINYE